MNIFDNYLYFFLQQAKWLALGSIIMLLLYQVNYQIFKKYQEITKTFSKGAIISDGETTIGRKGNIAFPNDKFISRTHAKIILYDNALSIEDLNSQNGTFINSTKIHKRRIKR